MMQFFDSCSEHSDRFDDTRKNRKWRGQMLCHRAFNPFGFQNILNEMTCNVKLRKCKIVHAQFLLGEGGSVTLSQARKVADFFLSRF